MMPIPPWGMQFVSELPTSASCNERAARFAGTSNPWYPRHFNRVQARLKGRIGRVLVHARNHADVPLRRFVTCSECGKPLTGAWSRGRAARYAYYECPGCRQVRVSKTDADATSARGVHGVRRPRFLNRGNLLGVRGVSNLASPTMLNSNRLFGWLREMDSLRGSISTAA